MTRLGSVRAYRRQCYDVPMHKGSAGLTLQGEDVSALSADLVLRLRAVAEARGSSGPAHDFQHVLRVAASARRIGEEEGARQDVVVPAALLHELFNHPKGHPDSPRSGEVCAEHAREVLQDADRLDAIGAIGIARCMATCAEMKRPFYSPIDPFCVERSPDDKAWGIDHFYAKLLRIPDALHTATARAMAGERLAMMTQFLGQLAREI